MSERDWLLTEKVQLFPSGPERPPPFALAWEDPPLVSPTAETFLLEEWTAPRLPSPHHPVLPDERVPLLRTSGAVVV